MQRQSVTEPDHFAIPEGERIVPSLVDYLQVLRRRRWMFLAAVLLVPTLAAVLTMRQAPSYRASAQVLLDRETVVGSQAPAMDPEREVQTQADLARVPAVATRAIEASRVANLTPADFLKSSGVAPMLGSDFLMFSVTSSSPNVARRLATAYADAYVDYRQDLNMQELRNARAAVQERLGRLETRGLKGSSEYRSLAKEERRLGTLEALNASTAKVVRPADRATKVGPKIIRNEMIGLVLGLVLGLALAFLWDALDTRVRSIETLRNGLGLRLLGRLPAPQRKPQEGRLVMLAAPLSHEAEAFRVLRAGFEYANADYQARTIMVTSAVGEEGKSTTVANLAVALARAGRRVVLIDSDLRRPALHRFFDLGQRPGLVDVELGEVELEAALHPVSLTQWDSTGANGRAPTSRRVGQLEVLTAGHAFQAPDELGMEQAVGRIAERLRPQTDLVLIDAPPLLLVGDALALSAHVDGIVLVVRHNSLRKSAFDDLRRTLASTPARKLGFILTDTETRDAYTHFYRYAPPMGRGDVPVTYEPSRAPDE
jgi:succinoglycan biosynthesis transport protein ExoP